MEQIESLEQLFEQDPDKTPNEVLAYEEAETKKVLAKNPGAKVIMLKVPKDDSYRNFAYAWIKYPSRVDVSIAMTMRDTDPLKGKEIVLRNSWLDGDMSILNDDELFLSACTVLDEVINIRQAIIKKKW